MQAELLDKEAILRGLSPLTEQKIPQIDIFPIIGSTNDYLLSCIPQGLAHGTVCIAESQTAGRGRQGKTWHSPMGANIYLSLYWHFSSPFQALSGLSLVVAIALLEALKVIAPLPKEMGIKWPNDIWFKEAKLAGILLEARGKDLNQVVIGIGLNVDLSDSITLNWVDLKQAFNLPISRQQIVVSLLEQLITNLEKFEREGFSPFQSLWQQYDLLAGKNVFLSTPTGKEEGRVKGINDRGELLVQVGETLKAISYGEVSVRTEN
jgi:BirA family transcriptional regulator, biotin operon repressor / biotin---[acetyl-CoA-carboxylase] ligase